MSSDIIISARNLTKTYRAYAHPLDRLLGGFIPGRAKRCKEFHALNDVSFDIKRGETVGIIGRNGSGKSTLLQLICGIRKPTSGSLQVNGRISALLELGAGFHPEFTGRENVFLQGAIQGMSRQEMEARFDDIAAFADIGEYIDQPVKTYSSGMFVRLAFAVAVSTEPDILVVDEALGVGDEIFQRKCFARIEGLRAQGVTILFVSHSTKSVIEICQRTLLLNKGQLLADGEPKLVLDWYHELVYASPEYQLEIADDIRSGTRKHMEGVPVLRQVASNTSFEPLLITESKLEYERRGAFISNARILDNFGNQVNVLERGNEYLYTYDVTMECEPETLRFGMMIKTKTGVELGGMNRFLEKNETKAKFEGKTFSVSFPFRCMLLPNIYFFNAGVGGKVNGTDVFFHRVIDIYAFRVRSDSALSTLGGDVDFSSLERQIDIREISKN